jgi:hypothetical protein
MFAANFWSAVHYRGNQVPKFQEKEAGARSQELGVVLDRRRSGYRETECHLDHCLRDSSFEIRASVPSNLEA